jgi:transposase
MRTGRASGWPPMRPTCAAASIVLRAIERVRALYAVERQCKDVSVEQRLKLPRQQSAPLWLSCGERILTWKEQLLPKHPMAEALNYALSQWAELNAFCSEGAVSIDNNVSEREMERIVLNRNNSLFVGNPRGGRTAATLASPTSTCRRHDVDPRCISPSC